jgi:diphosphomevalonate decarboxylase
MKKNKINIVGWKVPANIALIKYWGKRDIQIPQNPSLSIALSNSFTETQIEYNLADNDSEQSLSFYFEGKKHQAFEDRIRIYFSLLEKELPFISKYNFAIHSKNSFPHSSGIASSASSMASLALCLMSIYEEVNNLKLPENEFFQKGSYYARLGSGSASRSVYGGYSVWGETELLIKSSDLFAIPFTENIHVNFEKIRLAVMLVSSSTKEVSSSQGHALMHNHPYADARFKQANKNLKRLIEILKSRNKDEFFELVESEALSLHSMMMTSIPSYILLKPNSLQIIELIRNARKNSGLNIGFTIDAGANIHLIYFEDQKEGVHQFIKDELEDYCENKLWIDDKLGDGPVQII